MVAIDGDLYRVHEINILSGQVRMFGPQGQYTSVPVCALEREEASPPSAAAGDRRRRSGGGRDLQWRVNHENCPLSHTAGGEA